MPDEKVPQIFLSYASENLDMVRKVYDGLVKRKLNIWFDKKHLGPGKWKPQIERAIRRSRYFIICLSNAAIKKTGDEPGFQDHELNEAYNIARDQSDQEFTIIPVRIEDCHRGDHRLTLFQQYDLFEGFDEGLDKLAVNMGGISLANPTAKDERTENEKLIANIRDKAFTERYAGRLQQSMTLMDSVLVLSPDDFETLMNKVAVFMELGKSDKALETLNRTVEIYKNKDIKIHEFAFLDYLRGVALSVLGKNEEAIEAYESALSKNPELGFAWNNKGDVLRTLAKNEEAIEAYNQALKINPDYASAWKNKALALSGIGKHRESLEAFDQALKIDPNHADSWLGKGIVLGCFLGNLKEGIEALDRGLKIKPNFAEGFLTKGGILQVLKKPEEAIEAFDQAIKIKPSYSEAWIHKGLALKELGKFEEAIEAYDKAIKIKPDFAEAWINKGNTLIQLGNLEAAIESFDQTIKIEHDYAEAWINKGVVLGKLGQSQEALQVYDQALKIKPDNFDAWYGKGINLGLLAKFGEALEALNQALKIKPDDANAMKLRDYLIKKIRRQKKSPRSKKK